MNKAETVHECQSKDKLEKPVKRNREDKQRKKDDKSVDHVLKALSSLETTEEKLGAMCQKYAEMFNDHRILQNAAKVAEKKNSILQKEKEQLQAEHSKAILTRSRLENLCRELQRQNKAVKEECMLKIREEEEKKREVAAKFQSTLTELGNLLAQNNDKNAKLRDDNLEMTNKLKNVCEQYEQKEQHVEKMAKQMHLEMQLANTKLAKAKMEMALEKEALLRDNQQLLLELKEYKTQLEEMKTSEVALRSQIQLYNDKYDEFHKALLQSNDAIGSFKQEMERMAKQIRKLEKETVAWKRRYETTHRTLLQMTEEKIKSDELASVSERRLTALQGLCRSLQAQCNHLRGVVKSQTAASPTDASAINAVTGIEMMDNRCEEPPGSDKLEHSDETLQFVPNTVEPLTMLIEQQPQSDSGVIQNDNCYNQVLEVSKQNGSFEEVVTAAAVDFEISESNLVLENGVDNINQPTEVVVDSSEQLHIESADKEEPEIEDDNLVLENGVDDINNPTEVVVASSEQLNNTIESADKEEPEIEDDTSCEHLSIPVSRPLPNTCPSNIRNYEQVVNDEAAILEEATLEKMQSVQQQLSGHQPSGKRNKGKRKKNGPALLKTP